LLLSDPLGSIPRRRRLNRRSGAFMHEPLAHIVFPVAAKNPASPTEAFSAFEGDVTEAGSARVRSRRERRFEIGGGGFSAF